MAVNFIADWDKLALIELKSCGDNYIQEYYTEVNLSIHHLNWTLVWLLYVTNIRHRVQISEGNNSWT